MKLSQRYILIAAFFVNAEILFFYLVRNEDRSFVPKMTVPKRIQFFTDTPRLGDVKSLDKYDTNSTEMNQKADIQRAKQGRCLNGSFFNETQPRGVLASFPGSGDVWVRYLLEQVTGERILLLSDILPFLQCSVTEYLLQDKTLFLLQSSFVMHRKI